MVREEDRLGALQVRIGVNDEIPMSFGGAEERALEGAHGVLDLL